jgi:hypothetical protein
VSERIERTFQLEATFSDLPDGIPGSQLVNGEYVGKGDEHISVVLHKRPLSKILGTHAKLVWVNRIVGKSLVIIEPSAAVPTPDCSTHWGMMFRWSRTKRGMSEGQSRFSANHEL